jgi:hypothetical protein
MTRDTLEGGRALIVQHCAVWGDLPTQVCQFTVRSPEPYAQYPTSVLVLFKEPKRRNSAYFKIYPDSIRNLTIEQDGAVIYDSRSEVPCDMEEWHRSAARHTR